MSRARLGHAWRYAALSGGATGLAAAPAFAPPPLGLIALAALGVAAGRAGRGRPPRAAIWLATVGALAALAGMAVGNARLQELDAEALMPAEGTRVAARGVVVSPPRAGASTTRLVVDTGRGRIGVEIEGPPPTKLVQGAGVQVAGVVRAPEDWEKDLWRRDGVRAILTAQRLAVRDWGRGGLAGALDGVRNRARDALGSGTSEPAAALLRGFVLGEDDRIAEPVREDFRRSGLAHVLAVSGQNVMLLVLLAMALLAALGVGWRARIVWAIGLVAIYVPVAGSAASIQRAGVMGIVGLIAVLASRPRAGWYALLLAAVATLTLDPRAASDIGWQLSFAAVAGLFLLARPLAAALAPSGAQHGTARRMLVEGAAITIAASLATAPLVAHHFEVISMTALPANVVALPAIAPAMWLGMLAGAVGQLPGAPVEPLTALGGLCAGYVGWVANALGPSWAELDVGSPGPLATAAWTAVLLSVARLACRVVARRSALRPRPPASGRRRALVAALALGGATALGALALPGRPPAEPPDLELRFLDVGQGDSILLSPRGSDPLLVDTGPAERALPRLRELGVERLAAVVVTHDQADHTGGLAQIVGELEVAQLVTGPGPPPADCRSGVVACPPIVRVATGDSLRVSRLRLDVLWPAARAQDDADPNHSALVLVASQGRFDALLTGDAESEASAFRPRAVELLKVAHHGSADAGLPRLLDAADPSVAVISTGSGNPYGHPAPATEAALAAAGVPALRTDRDGEVVVSVRDDGWTVE